MNLREFNSGTPSTKTWLAPVCGVLTCSSVDAEKQFLKENVYTSLEDLQGFGLGPHTLLPAGEGSLIIPPNTLRKGSVFKLSCKGIFTCPGGATLTFRLKGTSLGAGTQDILVLSIVKILNSTIKNFSVDFTVVCRKAGAIGVSDLQAFGEGFVRVDVGLAPETLGNDSPVVAFGTDEALSLQLTAESDTPVLNIVSQIAYIEI